MEGRELMAGLDAGPMDFLDEKKRAVIDLHESSRDHQWRIRLLEGNAVAD